MLSWATQAIGPEQIVAEVPDTLLRAGVDDRGRCPQRTAPAANSMPLPSPSAVPSTQHSAVKAGEAMCFNTAAACRLAACQARGEPRRRMPIHPPILVMLHRLCFKPLVHTLQHAGEV